MRSFLRWFLPPMVLLVGAGAFLLLWSSRPKVEARTPEVRPPLVETVATRAEALTVTVRSEGTVRPQAETTLVPEVSGKVVRVSRELVAGGTIRRGQELFALDETDYAQAVVQGEARVAAAEVRLAREEAEAEVARREWDRLHPGEEPSPLTARTLQVAEARADLAAQRAALDKAKNDLARTRIVAPYDGRVRRESVDLGQFVSRGQAIAEIYATDRAEIRLPLPDNQLAFLELDLSGRKRGPAVSLTAEFAGATHRWSGRIERTEGEIDPQTRMVHVVAVVDAPYAVRDGRPPLTVGMFVEAEIEGRAYDAVHRLPRRVLRGDDELWVIDGEDRLHRRTVDVLRATTDEVIVRRGLADGERVCLTSLAAVTDGMQVRTTGTESGS